MINIAWHAFLQHPIVGVGALNFPEYLINYGSKGFLRSQNIENISPHNVFLEVAAEEGIFGVTSFITILIMIYLILKREKKFPSNDNLSHYQNGLKLFFITLIIALAFGYIAGQFRFFFAIFCGLSIALLRLQILRRTNY